MNQLKELYYNPKTGLISANKIYHKLNKSIPLSTIKDFIEKQEIAQLAKVNKRKMNYKHINVYSANNQWQIDLVDFSKFSHWNSGFKYLFCIVDVFSRKSFVVPLKRKSETTTAMKKVLTTQKPILIQSDNGTEFLNQSFRALLKANNIQHTTVQVGDHNRQGIVERFNRTIERIISKYQETRNTNGYINILHDIVWNYNNTYHSSIKDTPDNKYNKNSDKGTFKDVFNIINLKIGDKVRLLKDRTIFQKDIEHKYSKTIYQIVNGNGYTFSVKHSNGTINPKKYKFYQLQKIVEVENFSILPKLITRAKPATLGEKRNQRELEELNRIAKPLNKRRRIDKQLPAEVNKIKRTNKELEKVPRKKVRL
jgi:transposase InsO family protein